MTTTLRQMNDLLMTIADKHLMINRYGFGELNEVNVVGPEAAEYPLMFVVPQQSLIAENQLVYTLRIIIMDIDDTDDSKRVEILSDTLQTLNDIILLLKTINNNDFNVDSDTTCYPFSQRFVDYTVGWWADISIITDIYNNPCPELLPLKDFNF